VCPASGTSSLSPLRRRFRRTTADRLRSARTVERAAALAPPAARDSWLSGAVKRCQANDPTFPRVTAHALRHTAASLAVSSGANPKVVQRMLGHTSAAMTLDVYADLFDTDLDSVAQRMDSGWSPASRDDREEELQP
jgi:integrase